MLANKWGQSTVFFNIESRVNRVGLELSLNKRGAVLNAIKSGQLKNIICSACVVYLDTGETESLTTKENSYCHFFDPIYVEHHKIILRLDWSDLDACGHPTLDADFYDATTGEKLPLSGERRDAHHTNAKTSEARTYEWEFRELNRPFKVRISWKASVRDNIGMQDIPSCEVIRNGVKMDD